MTISLGVLKNAILTLVLLMGGTMTFAADDQVKEDVAKFSQQCSKLREDHIQEMRELHVKHINEMYDRKLANVRELEELYKQLKPGDKTHNKALREQIKEKQDSFKKEEEKNRKEFKENVLKKKNKEFQEAMKTRMKEMKSKYKD